MQTQSSFATCLCGSSADFSKAFVIRFGNLEVSDIFFTNVKRVRGAHKANAAPRDLTDYANMR